MSDEKSSEPVEGSDVSDVTTVDSEKAKKTPLVTYLVVVILALAGFAIGGLYGAPIMGTEKTNTVTVDASVFNMTLTDNATVVGVVGNYSESVVVSVPASVQNVSVDVPAYNLTVPASLSDNVTYTVAAYSLDTTANVSGNITNVTVTVPEQNVSVPASLTGNSTVVVAAQTVNSTVSIPASNVSASVVWNLVSVSDANGATAVVLSRTVPTVGASVNVANGRVI